MSGSVKNPRIIKGYSRLCPEGSELIVMDHKQCGYVNVRNKKN